MRYALKHVWYSLSSVSVTNHMLGVETLGVRLVNTYAGVRRS